MTPDHSTPSSQPASRKPALIIASLFMLSVFIFLILISEEDKQVGEEPVSYLPVSVVSLAPQNHQVQLMATGITQPRWSTGLVSSVSAKVKKLPDGLEPGSLVGANQLLLELEATALQANFDDAQSRLAEAELNLEQNLHQQTVALKSGGNNTTAYGRFEPQVKGARQQVKAAKALVANAQHELSNTKLKAPFSAIVLKRSVTPGQWVQVGETLFQLAAQDSIDIKTELTDKHWQQLAGKFDSLTAMVVSQKDQWPATIRYIDPVRDPNTRQRSLVLKVANPFDPDDHRQTLLPDTQVEVRFNGQKVSEVFVCPASVMTEDGLVWTLNEQNQLQLESVELIQQTVEQVIVRFQKQPEQVRRIVLYPLASMIEGQQVSPEEIGFAEAMAQENLL